MTYLPSATLLRLASPLLAGRFELTPSNVAAFVRKLTTAKFDRIAERGATELHINYLETLRDFYKSALESTTGDTARELIMDRAFDVHCDLSGYDHTSPTDASIPFKMPDSGKHDLASGVATSCGWCGNVVKRRYYVEVGDGQFSLTRFEDIERETTEPLFDDEHGHTVLCAASAAEFVQAVTDYAYTQARTAALADALFSFHSTHEALGWNFGEGEWLARYAPLFDAAGGDAALAVASDGTVIIAATAAAAVSLTVQGKSGPQLNPEAAGKFYPAEFRGDTGSFSRYAMFVPISDETDPKRIVTTDHGVFALHPKLTIAA